MVDKHLTWVFYFHILHIKKCLCILNKEKSRKIREDLSDILIKRTV